MTTNARGTVGGHPGRRRSSKSTGWLAAAMPAVCGVVLVAAGAVRQAPAPAAAVVPPEALAALEWRSIGPIRGGRSIAVAGVSSRAHQYYFGATGGGLWKTDNGGVSWFAVGDGQFGSSSVGAIEVCEANPDVVYVGFGEVQLRGNVVPGDGVYRTTNGGRTWTHLGLASGTGQQTIGRLRVHPGDCDTVYAAVFGDPFGPNAERGVFRSLDGGRTWRHVLHRSDRAGAVDLALAPGNPRIVYAGFWEAYRRPWLLWSGGDGSGLFRSADGGDTWTELTRNPGLPTGLWGKVAVSVSGADANRVYANIEARDGGVFVSSDGGDTWTLTSADRNLRTRAFYYTRITADPQERDTVYVNNENFWRSRDAGRTWDRIRVPHEDNHDLWIDPANNQRMIQGNDGGANVSVDGGRTWTAQAYPTAQIYTVTATRGRPYLVCGTQQDQGGGFCVPSDGDGDWWLDVGGGESGWIVPDPDDPAAFYAGSQTNQLTRFDRATGQLRSISPWPIRTVGRSAGEVTERFQWTFPIAVSPVPPRALYVGSQHLWRSRDRGARWERISPDLTRADPETLGPSGGPLTLDRTTVEHYGTIFAIAPSAHDPETIWVGSDDGLVHLTRDGGRTWTNVTPPGLPTFSRVNFIDASPHRPGTAVLAAGRYRMQDVAPYIWKTDDFGRTWSKIVGGIRPGDHVRTVVEDPAREGLLFAGTENGVYVSLDDGASWRSLQLNLPVSPVYALAVAGIDLVAATHGRSFWVLDDITPLRQLTPDAVAKPAHLFRPATAIRSKARPTDGYRRIPSAGGVNLYYHLLEPAREVTIEVLDREGTPVRTWTSSGVSSGGERTPGRTRGLHVVRWDLRYPGHTTFPGLMLRFSRGDGPAAPPGAYRVRLTVDGREAGSEPLVIEKDPRLTDVTQADLDEQFGLAVEVRDQTSQAHEAVIRIRDLTRQVDARLQRTTSAAVREAAERFKAAIAAVERELYEVRLEAPEDQLNFGLKLNNDLAVLLVEIETGDGRPTASQRAVFAELSRQLGVQLGALDQAIARDLPALNRLLEAASLEPIRSSGGSPGGNGRR